MIMKNHFYRLTLGTLIAAAALGLGLNAEAQTRLTESFSAPVGGLPANWTPALLRKDNRAEGVQIVALPGQDALAALLIEREGRVAESGALYYTGSDGAIVEGKLSDLFASVTLRYSESVNGPNYRGFMLRANRIDSRQPGGYYVAVAPRGKERELAIYHNPVSHVNQGELLARVPLKAALAPNTDYVLSVRAKGAVIEASLRLAGADENAAPIASVRTDAATQTQAGYFGLRGAYSNSGPIRTWFRQLHLTDTVR